MMVYLRIAMLVLPWALAGWQWYRAENAIDDLADRERAVEKASTDSKVTGATTGLEAVTSHVDTIKAEAPAVAGAVDHIRALCVRVKPDRHLSVPQGTGPVDARTAESGNDRDAEEEDRRFADALGRDLAICSDELSRLRQLQNWVKANGG